MPRGIPVCRPLEYALARLCTTLVQYHVPVLQFPSTPLKYPQANSAFRVWSWCTVPTEIVQMIIMQLPRVCSFRRPLYARARPLTNTLQPPRVWKFESDHDCARPSYPLETRTSRGDAENNQRVED